MERCLFYIIKWEDTHGLLWFYALQLQMPRLNYGITIVNIHKENCKVQSRDSKPGPSWIMDYAINSPPCIICSN